MKKIIFMTALVALLASCSKGGDKRLAQQETIRAQEQLQAQNENQKQWAEKMELDLNKRKYFLKAIKGEFEGELNIKGTLFTITAKFLPSIPVQFSDRTRTLEEINYEIQNLSLNLNVKIENPSVDNSASSCTIEGYKPDIANGVIAVLSESCKNIFNLAIADSLDELSINEASEAAYKLSNEVTSGQLERVDFFDGFFESSVSSKQYRLKLKRSK